MHKGDESGVVNNNDNKKGIEFVHKEGEQNGYCRVTSLAGRPHLAHSNFKSHLGKRYTMWVLGRSRPETRRGDLGISPYLVCYRASGPQSAAVPAERSSGVFPGGRVEAARARKHSSCKDALLLNSMITGEEDETGLCRRF